MMNPRLRAQILEAAAAGRLVGFESEPHQPAPSLHASPPVQPADPVPPDLNLDALLRQAEAVDAWLGRLEEPRAVRRASWLDEALTTLNNYLAANPCKSAAEFERLMPPPEPVMSSGGSSRHFLSAGPPAEDMRLGELMAGGDIDAWTDR